MTTSTWKTVTLDTDSWHPARLLPHLTATFPESFEGPSSQLMNHCVVVDPRSDIEPGIPFVGPQSVDPVTGAIARLEPGKGRFGHHLAHNSLEVGDILMPVTPLTPAVLVTNELANLACSTRFIALRVIDDAAPTLIWALLSSTSGQLARANTSTRSVIRTASAKDILALTIPEPGAIGPSSLLSVSELVPEPLLRLVAGSTPRSKWSVATLEEDWAQTLAGADELEPIEGIPLHDIAEVVVPRAVRRSEHLKTRVEGAQPLWRAQDVTKGTGPCVWAIEQSDRQMVQPGDVLIAQFGPKHRVAIADARAILGSHVLAIRLADSRLSNALAIYLSSPAGQERLHRIESGTTHRRVNPTSLRKLRIPWPLPQEGEIPFAPEDRRSLAEKLQEALWLQ
jgi:hypothetical protein